MDEYPEVYTEIQWKHRKTLKRYLKKHGVKMLCVSKYHTFKDVAHGSPAFSITVTMSVPLCKIIFSKEDSYGKLICKLKGVSTIPYENMLADLGYGL